MPATPRVRPPLRREQEGKMVAGVATGLATHLGINVWLVRAALVGLTLFSGAGVLAYGALWALTPWATGPVEAAGLDAARRRGMRPAESASQFGPDPGIIVALGMLLLGVLWLFVLGGAIPVALFWPMVIGGLGVVIIWLQTDRIQEPAAELTIWSRLSRGGGAMSLMRLVGGLILVGGGISWFLATQIGFARLPGVLGASAVLLAGFVVAAAPWVFRQRSRLNQADADRVRAEARADMAAHLHDSVLQTLALIQRQAGDSATVTTLARRQERELRTWLYGETTRASSLRSALREVCADVETNFPIDVEVVCVGDTEVNDRVEALILAVGEAVTNAAKHSGAMRVDVYAEVADERVEVFVRDRGRGFDLDAVRDDRMGVRQSIKARMERHGGVAIIRSGPGGGTEVRLEIGA